MFRLKGAGWYETDFKTDKDNKRNLVGADKDEPRSEAKPAEAKESKPEAKEEARSGKETEGDQGDQGPRPKRVQGRNRRKTQGAAQETQAPARKAPRKGRR